MKTKHAVISALVLLGTAFTLTAELSEAAMPTREGGASYPFYREKGKFGVGFNASANYETFDYPEMCRAVPSKEKATATCESEMKKIFSGLKMDPAVISALAHPCVAQNEAARKQYCNKDGKYLEASADAGVTAKLFNAKVDILGVEAHANADSTSASTGYSVSVVGKKVAGMERPARLELTMPYVFPLFKAAATFGLGPLSVSVSAETVGTFGVVIGAQAGSAGVQFDGTPFSSVDVIAGASVGKWLAEVGVEGTVNLVDLRVPAKVALTLADSRTVRWSGGADLTFDALSGSIDLYGKLAGARVGSLTIFEWSGIPQKKYSIFQNSGLVNF